MRLMVKNQSSFNFSFYSLKSESNGFDKAALSFKWNRDLQWAQTEFGHEENFTDHWLAKGIDVKQEAKPAVRRINIGISFAFRTHAPKTSDFPKWSYISHETTVLNPDKFNL